MNAFFNGNSSFNDKAFVKLVSRHERSGCFFFSDKSRQDVRWPNDLVFCNFLALFDVSSTKGTTRREQMNRTSCLAFVVVALLFSSVILFMLTGLDTSLSGSAQEGIHDRGISRAPVLLLATICYSTARASGIRPADPATGGTVSLVFLP